MIVDANVHATPDGRWFDTKFDASLDRLRRELDSAGVERAALTGLPGQISTDAVVALCDQEPERLIPVGSLDPMRERVGDLKDRGLVGFKLHPRLGGYDPLEPKVLSALDEAASWERPPVVWLCTLLHAPGITLRKPPVETLHELVARYGNLRFILAHGGGPDLLRLATAVRSSRNAYLDLSFTLTKFRGSSVELDMRHLMTSFDNRLVYGSDFPEVSIPDALAALDDLLAGADSAVVAKLHAGNLLRAIGAD